MFLLISIVALASVTQQCLPGHDLSLEQLADLNFAARGKQTQNWVRWPKAQPPYVLGEIRFVRQNVFPDRQHWLARQANRFNTITSEKVLLAAFPLNVGEEVDETKRQEAERVLRSKAYLYEARILLRQTCGNRVDFDVVVRDVWTLTPGINLNRSGGDNEISVSLSDVNFLGTGKSLSIEYFDDVDRSGTFVSYDDPNILGSRWRGSLVAADNDDGERYGASLTRPFYALDTRYAFGFAVNHFLRNQDLEFLGEDQFEIRGETDSANLFVARGTGRQKGWVSRQFAGIRYLDERFEYPADFPGPTEDVRKFVFPYLAWSLMQDRFEARTDIDRVGVVEDIDLGWNAYAELGWSTDGFGGTGDYLLARGSVSHRQYLAPGHLLSLSADLKSRYDLDNNVTEDLRMATSAEYLWQQSDNWRFFARLDYRQTRNLPLDTQLTLGGDNGLRGYPNRYQIGDRSVLASLEQRYYSNAYPFGLFRVGYAAFVDVGRAWFEDEPPAWVPALEGRHFDTLSNVGVGLRLESVRTRRDRLLHIDLAKPLVDGPGVNTWEFTITAKQSF